MYLIELLIRSAGRGDPPELIVDGNIVSFFMETFGKSSKTNNYTKCFRIQY
jgi:hypothetical protein